MYKLKLKSRWYRASSRQLAHLPEAHKKLAYYSATSRGAWGTVNKVYTQNFWT